MYKYMLLIFSVILCVNAEARPKRIQNTQVGNTESYRKRLIIPNIISSVDSAYPSAFQILNLDKEQVLLFTIYNKWGSSMYVSKDNNASWDGMYKGKMQPDGEYGYKIQIKYEDGVIEEYQGILMLVNNFKTKSM